MKPSEERKRILHKRWAIAIVIAAIIATLLHIWYLVLAFIFIVGGTCLGLNLIIDVMSWLEGDDLGPDLKSKNKRPSDSGQENDISIQCGISILQIKLSNIVHITMMIIFVMIMISMTMTIFVINNFYISR